MPKDVVEIVESKFEYLPKEWDEEQLGSVCDVQGGYAFKSKKYSASGRVVVKIGSLQNGTVIENKRTSYWPESEVDKTIKKYELKNGDVLIAMTGATTGKLAIVPKGYSGSLLNQRVGRFLPQEDERFDKLFGRYFFQTNYFQEEIGGNILKSAQGNISPSKIKSIEIPLPPLPEQRKIAAILSTVQDAIEQTQAVIQATRELKKSMMKHLFTYGPVPVDQTDKVELQETEIGLMPEEWSLKKLGRVADFRNGINFKSEQKGEKGILAIDVLNMYTDSVYPSTQNLYRVDKKIKEDSLLKNGDLLFVRSSLKQEGVGWTTVFEENLSDEPITYVGFIIRARLKEHKFHPKFLAYYFRSDIGRKNLIKSSGKVAITNINQGMLGSNIIPKPDIELQKQIVKNLDLITQKIHQEIDKKKSLQTLFNSLLENLMTAKIRV